MDSTKPVHRSQRVISWLIISLLVWQPVAPAFAAAIAPNGQTTMDKAGNGVPVVNIATPNASGISHNQFQDYNVGKEGLILNNATGQLTQTQLGGLIQNNPNLQAGKEARGIINEVVGASRSQLQGYTEVAGKAANVIVANPYGITCNGCGFINTPNATLTTGKPQFDANGNLAALDVTQGSITVEGQGLDASGSDALSLISRATEVNAAIHAKDLTVTVGANRVDASGKATAIASQSPAPTIAVDTGALGGMYANRIHLVSSDKGVGVNLGNLTARQGDITLDASGKLTVKNSLASGSLNARGDGVSLTGEHKAGGAATLTSMQELTLKDATLAADGAVSLGSNGKLSATNSSLTSGKGLTMSASKIGLDGTSRADAAGDVSLSGGDITNQGEVNTSGSLVLSANTLDNSGKLAAKGRVDAQASRLNNSGSIQGNGVTVHAGTTQNSGALQSSDVLSLTGDALSQSGTLSAGGDMTLSLTGALENGGQGKTLSDGLLQIDAGTWTQNGTLSGQQGLTVNAGNLYGGEGSLTSSLGEIHLNATQHAGFDGQVSATGNLTVTADDVATGTHAQLQSSDTLNLQANSATLDGTQAAKNALTVTAKTLSHGGKSSADNITLNAPQTLTNSGTMQADALTLSSDHITNSGLLQGTHTLGLHTDRLDNLAGGTLYSVHDLTFDIPELNNSGLITTDSHLRLGGRSLTNAGEINGVTFDVVYQSVDNRSTGRLLADEGLAFTADSITNAGLLGAKQLSVTANSLVNQGSVQGNDALTLTTAETTNSGTLRSGGTLTLNGQTLDNSGNLTATSLLLNLTQHAKNSAAGQITATHDATLFTPELLNSGLISASDLALESADITNSGTLQGINALVAKGTQLVNQQGGVVLSNGAVTLTHDRLDNRGQIQGDTLDLATGEWINSGNALGENGITAKVDGNVTNQGKILSQKTLTLTANQSQNSGTLAAKVLALHSDLQNSGILQGSDTLNWDGNTFTSTSNGQVLSGNTLTLQGKEIDNQGQIQSRALTLTADNWQNGGAVQAQDNLSATLTGTLNNKGTLLSQNLSTLSAGTLLNDGKLAAKNLNISAPSLTSNGILQGNESLTLTTRNLLNGANGQFISGSALDLNLDRLENQGLLYVNGGFTLKGNTLLNGGNLEADALDLHVDTLLNNPGVLLAHNGATLYGDTIANSGQIAGNTVALTATGITNSGLIQGTQQAQATAQRMTNATAGKWLSGGDFIVNVDVLNNAGTLQGNRIGLTGTTLDNQGVINGLTNLTGVFSGDLINGGQLISGGSTDLRATSLNNSGRLIGDTLALNAGSLSNSGLWQGTTGLVLQADTLTTDVNSRTLSGGDFTLTAGQLTTQGTLQGGLVNITSDDWTHKGSLLSQEGLTADVAGSLTTPGSIMSQKGLVIRAQQTDNSGSILSEGAATLSGQTLKNQGSVQGKSLALHQDSITNNGALTGLDSLTLDAKKTLMARMAMATPQLTLINGANGQLLTQGTLDVAAGSVTNAGVWQGKNILLAAQSLENSGAIQSADGLNISVSGTLNSTAGSKITAMGSAALDALALTNQGQWAANNLVLNADTLTNGGVTSGVNGLTLTLNGALTQQPTGTLQSNGVLSVTAASVANQGKVVGGTLAITTGALTNSGRLQSDSDTTLTLSGNLTNNASGEIVSGRGLTVTTPSMLNYGLIQGSGETRLDATTLASNDGKVLSGGRLTLTTPQYTGAGVLQATNLILNAASNTGSGKLVADLMTLTGDTFTNQGTTQAGELVLNYRQLTNNGTLLGTSKLTVNATQVDQSASGKLFSGGDLFVGATGLNALGQMVALGNLTLQLANAFTAQTTLAAGQTLSITSNGAITNQSVMQGQAVNLTAGGQLTNNGQVTTGSGSSTLSGSQVVLNTGSSIQGGGDVTLASRGNITANGFVGTLGNLTLSAPGSLINTALLYAANNMSLYANSITNQRGNILAGNNLWMQRDAAGNANSDVTNTSGTIETRNGDISIKTGRLLNQREGLSVSETTIPGTIDLASAPTIIKVAVLNNPNFSILERYEERPNASYDSSGYSYYYSYIPNVESLTQTRSAGTREVKVTSSGGAARISSGRNIIANTGSLDNLGSNILAAGNVFLDGASFNNKSYEGGYYSEQIIYDYVLPNKTTIITKSQHNPYSSQEVNDVRIPSLTGVTNQYYRYPPLSGLMNYDYKLFNGNLDKLFDVHENLYVYTDANKNDDLEYNPVNSLDATSASYKLRGKESVYTPGEIYRSVIQAGGTVTANFSSNISNTNTTANAGGVSSTITAPSLNTLSNQSIGGSVQKEALTNAGPVAVNSPQWQDQLQGALQQINGGGALDNSGASGTSLTNVSSQQKGNASLGNAPSLVNVGATNAVLTSTNNGALGHYTGKTVDTSAYPLPTGNDGYFVVTDNPKSPYLITINPKLDGLGQLDPALFGDLNKLLGINPSAAPRETNTAYTDEKQFLGSSYMLSRINLNPDYDYRFLGDAAFDTRYVSNVILNQTGNRYLNGVGSDLAQMQYLMDNAASAQQSLGLQFGVSLTADQIAALNHSILWWESATINGETVMVPKVYLSPNDVTVNNGSVIAGNNVNLSSGNITNGSSTLLAKNDLSVNSTGQINNTSDALIKAGGNLSLSAIGDINNLSSTISGKTVQLESLDGSINNITLADQYSLNAKDKYGSVNIKGTTLGSTASISAQDGLSLEAWNDINLVGAKLVSGGDMLLDAWGDVNVKAIQVSDNYNQSGFFGNKATSDTSTTWQKSGISAGGNLNVQAANDLTLTASDISAGKDAALVAGNNLNLNAEQTKQSSLKGQSETHATGQDRTTVSAGGDLKLAAGQDVTSQAAALAAEEKVTIQAGRDVNLQAEASTQGDSYKSKNKTVINEAVRQQGTEIASGTDTVIVAGRDVNTQAAQVTAQGDIGVTAGRDVNLNTATESDYAYKEKTVTSGGFLSKSTTHTVSEQSATHEAGTLLSGDNVTVKAGNDLLVKGSSVVGDGDVALNAGHNLDITAATNTDSNWQLKEKKKSGLMGSGGIGFTIGSSKSKQELKEKGTTQSQSVSTVGSNGGDVTITAGNQLHVGGSDLIAKNDLALTGDSVVIDPGHDKRTTDQKFEQKSSGLTVALTGAVVDAVNSAVTTAQAASKQSDSRLAALQATKSVLSGYQAMQGKEMADTTGEPDSGIRISVSLTTQKSKSEQHQKSDQVSGSTLNAGNDLSITATGKNHEANSGDIVVAGSSMKAGGDASLDAARDIVLAGAANTQKTTGSNSSSGGGVGVSFGVSQGGAGLSVFANVNAAKGNEKGDGTDWTETTLDSGGKVSLHSGQDATLTGAQVSGNQVTADIGRNLTVTSLQDSNNYDSKQSSISAGGSFTFGSMTGSGYINFSQDKMHSTFDSVAEQSGIFAGAGGFDVTVGSHTQLNGGAIGSTATADKNSLDTGTLGYSNITNKADYKVSHSGGGFSSSATMGAQAALSAASTLMSSVGSSGHAKGTTEAAVSEGTITVRDTANQQQDVSGLQRDVSQANDAISPIFNKEKEQNRLQAVQMISDIGNQVSDIVRTQNDLEGLKAALAVSGTTLEGLPEKERIAKLAELRNSQAYADATKDSGTGKDVQRAITAATAAISGLAGGNLNAALAGGAAPYIANEIGKNITENNTMAGIMAHAVVNAVLATAQGQNALVGAVGAVVGESVGILIAKEVYGKDPADLNEQEKQTVSALATLASGLAGGLIGDSTETATAAANAGKTTVENNWLSEKEARQFEKEIQDCKKSGGDCKEVIQKYIDISNKRSQELVNACTGGGVTCVGWEELIQANANVALDAHKHQIRLSEKLKDPDAAAIVKYLNGSDLKFLKDNITTSDRVLDVIMTPTSWPVAVMGVRAIITNGAGVKEQLLAVGVSSGVNAAFQYGTSKTGEIKLSDVIGAGVVSLITAGKGYNPTVTWNAVGSYYQAEIKGDDPFIEAVLGKAGASVGYVAGNIIKLPFEKKLNPISKQYEWESTGVWTITKPVPQSAIPSTVGNVSDSVGSGLFSEGMNQALKDKKEKQQ